MSDDAVTPDRPDAEQRRARQWAIGLQRLRSDEMRYLREDQGEEPDSSDDELVYWERQFGERVKQWRVKRSWSQYELAEKLREIGLDMHQTTVAKMERGARPLRVSEAVGVAAVMGMPVLSVFYGEGPQSEPANLRMLREKMDWLDERVHEAEKKLDEQFRVIANWEMLRMTTATEINQAAAEVDRGERSASDV